MINTRRKGWGKPSPISSPWPILARVESNWGDRIRGMFLRTTIAKVAKKKTTRTELAAQLRVKGQALMPHPHRMPIATLYQ